MWSTFLFTITTHHWHESLPGNHHLHSLLVTKLNIASWVAMHLVARCTLVTMDLVTRVHERRGRGPPQRRPGRHLKKGFGVQGGSDGGLGPDWEMAGKVRVVLAGNQILLLEVGLPVDEYVRLVARRLIPLWRHMLFCHRRLLLWGHFGWLWRHNTV